jgi:hypothetical protein
MTCLSIHPLPRPFAVRTRCFPKSAAIRKPSQYSSDLEENTPTEATVEVQIRRQVSTPRPQLMGNLRSPDFIDS